jgi:hypothetical protein
MGVTHRVTPFFLFEEYIWPLFSLETGVNLGKKFIHTKFLLVSEKPS